MTEVLGPKVDSTGLFLELGLKMNSPESAERESEKLQGLCEQWGYKVHARHLAEEGRRSRLYLVRHGDVAPDEEIRLLEDRLVHALYRFGSESPGD